jgi:hypothetical protein
MKLVNQRNLENENEVVEPPPSRQRQALDRKIDFLRDLLGRVQRHS